MVPNLNQCVLHFFKQFLTFGNVLMKISIKVYIFGKFYTVCRGLVYYYHHRSPSKVLPKEGPKIWAQSCVFTGPMMGRCKILDPIWSRLCLIGPYLGTVASGPTMGMCKMLVPKWSCASYLGPTLCIVTLNVPWTHYGNLKALKDWHSNLVPSW